MRHLLLVLALLVAAPAWAGQWTVGSNLGLSFFNPDEGDNSTIVGFPGSAGGLQPGLRIGRANDSGPHEFYADLGLLLADAGDVSTNAFELTANYQYNFSKGRTGPYVTGGVGFYSSGLEFTSFDFDLNEAVSVDLSATSSVIGLGAGLRTGLGDGGTARFELRYDLIGEAEDGNTVVQPAGSAIGLRVGFDLWL